MLYGCLHAPCVLFSLTQENSRGPVIHLQTETLGEFFRSLCIFVIIVVIGNILVIFIHKHVYVQFPVDMRGVQ